MGPTQREYEKLEDREDSGSNIIEMPKLCKLTELMKLWDRKKEMINLNNMIMYEYICEIMLFIDFNFCERWRWRWNNLNWSKYIYV